MATMKLKDSTGKWVYLYVDELQNRLRKDKNLTDLSDVNVARETLGVNSMQRDFINLATNIQDAENTFTDYNTMIIENYMREGTNTDKVFIKVLDMIPGDDKMTVNNARQLKVGHVYVLADEEQQEEIIIKAIKIENGVHTVFLESQTNYQYDNPFIFRTTKTESGFTRTFDYDGMTEWKGIMGNQENIMPFNTVLGNIDKMTTYGNVTFTSEDAFTIKI
jgi:hypothetical protein